MIRRYLVGIVLSLLCGQIVAQDALCAGKFDLKIQSGFAPIDWITRGSIYGVSCPVLVPNKIITKAIDFPDFNNLYKVSPLWGGQLGYAYSNSLRFFADFFF